MTWSLKGQEIIKGKQIS